MKTKTKAMATILAMAFPFAAPAATASAQLQIRIVILPYLNIQSSRILSDGAGTEYSILTNMRTVFVNGTRYDLLGPIEATKVIVIPASQGDSFYWSDNPPYL
jgi:hypothetical protein